MSLAPTAALHSLPPERCVSLVTFSFLFPACLCFAQHSYFIAPDINGLPTIPESVSIHGERDEKRPTEIKGDPSLLEPCLPLIVFNQIHLSPFEIIASSSCFSFISCSGWSSVIATSIRRFKLNTCCVRVQILPPVQVDLNSRSDKIKQRLASFYFPNTAQHIVSRLFFFVCWRQKCSEQEVQVVSSVLCVSSWHTPTGCGIDILGRFVMCCTCISFCSCLSPEEPDRVLCGCGRQQHAPALRQHAARTAHHHYLNQAQHCE